MEESLFYRLARPFVPKPLRPLVLRYQEVLSYLAVGGLTTLVNFAAYFPLNRAMHYLAANAIAWAAAVAFAYFANKILVFGDRRWDARHLLRQGAAFASMRLVSLGLEELILLLFVERLGLNADITKIAAQIITILLNYIFSRLLIFRKKPGDGAEHTETGEKTP